MKGKTASGSAHHGTFKVKWPFLAFLLATLVLWAALAAPAWAPLVDYRIAYVKGGDIWARTEDGASILQVTNTPEPESSPGWDANQRRLVFARGDEVAGPSDIFLYDFDTGLETTVTANGRSSHPSIRDNLVAYVREVTKSAGGIDFDVDQIATKNLSTGIYKKLTDFGPASDMAGPAAIHHTAFTPHGEAISFLFGRRWDARFIRVIRKTGGPVGNVASEHLVDTNFSWSMWSVRLYYAYRNEGGNPAFQNHTIVRRYWPSNGSPATETTVLTGSDLVWNKHPAIGHLGQSLAYELQAGNGGAGAVHVVNKDGLEDEDLVDDAGEPAWLNTFSANLGAPAAVNVGALPFHFNPPAKTKLRFRTGSKQTVLMKVTCYIYNAANHLVRVRGPYDKVVGYGYIYWDGRNNAGHVVAPGVYHYRIKATDASGLSKYSAFKNVVAH